MIFYSHTTQALLISQSLQVYFGRKKFVGSLRSNEVYEILDRKGLMKVLLMEKKQLKINI
jgi:hypothetical protein